MVGSGPNSTWCPPPHFIPLFIWQYLRKVASYLPSSLMLPSIKGKYLCLLQIGPSLCGECLLHLGFLDLLPSSKRTNVETENAVGFDIFHLRYVLSLIEGCRSAGLVSSVKGRPGAVSGFFLVWTLLEH